jgi:hypothetical protein
LPGAATVYPRPWPEAKLTMLALLITQPETWCGHGRRRVLHTKDHASQQRFMS